MVLPLLSGEHNNQPLSREAKAGGDWQQKHLRAAVNNWRQKWPATRASTITQQREMYQVRGNQHKQQPTIDRNSISGRRLATILPEGSGQWLAAKVAGNEQDNSGDGQRWALALNDGNGRQQ